MEKYETRFEARQKEKYYKIMVISKSGRDKETLELLDVLNFEYDITPESFGLPGLTSIDVKVPIKIARAMVKLI